MVVKIAEQMNLGAFDWNFMRMGRLQLQSNLKDPVQHCFALLFMFDLYASRILRYVQPTTRNQSVAVFMPLEGNSKFSPLPTPNRPAAQRLTFCVELDQKYCIQSSTSKASHLPTKFNTYQEIGPDN